MTGIPSASHDRGFSVVELLISMVIMVGVTGAIFTVVHPSRGTYKTQPEVSDMQQRLRVGTSFLSDDLLMAGAGARAGGKLMGSLANYFAPIQPLRIGLQQNDIDAGIFYRDDTVTVLYVPVDAGQTTIETDMPQPSAELKTTGDPSCLDTNSQRLSCKFAAGQRVVIFDETGAWDDMTITHVQDSPAHLQHNRSIVGNVLSKSYLAGSQLVHVLQRTYYWDRERLQLRYYDGYMRDEPVVDNVIGLRFEYFGEPRPALVIDQTLRATSYGPRPPTLADSIPGYPAGENCTFVVDAGTGQHAPRLQELAPGSQGLVELTREMLIDGPWCPHSTAARRFDADLLRVRKVGVRLRVQVASAAFRGPAGVLFSHGGSATGGASMVPDQEIHFDLTPRNLNLGR